MNRKGVWFACVSWLAVVGACAGPDGGSDIAAPDAQDVEAQVPEANVAKATGAGIHAAVGKSVTSSSQPNSEYPANGIESLVDGKMGTEEYLDPEWMGWWYDDKPFEATIDLGMVMPIHELGVNTLSSSEAWILYPKKVEFDLSMDGKTYEKVATIKPTKEDFEAEEPETKVWSQSKLNKTGRYVRVRVERFGELPSWHMASGGADGFDGEAWLFIDEILVNPK